MNPYGLEVIDRILFVTLSKDSNGRYFVHNDWNYVEEYTNARSDEEAKELFRFKYEKKNRLTGPAKSEFQRYGYVTNQTLYGR